MHDIRSHKKTLELSEILGIDECYAVGIMCCLWTWAIESAQDGDLAGMTSRMLSKAIGWQGDPDALLEALKRVRYIDPDMKIHDWYQYAGRLIEARRAKCEKEKERYAKRSRSIPLPPIPQERYKEQAAQAPKSGVYEAETSFGMVEVDVGYQEVQQSYVANIGSWPMGPAEDDLHSFYEEMGRDVMILAIQEANRRQPENPKQYLKDGILSRWRSAGIRNIEQAQAAINDFNIRKKQKSPGKPEESSDVQKRIQKWGDE